MIINKKIFKETCELLNGIVKSKYSNFITIAIPWMHVIRSHPIIISRYEKIYNDNYNKSFTVFKYLVKIVITLIKSFLNIRNLSIIGMESKSNIDYLFVSHLINKNQLNQKFDLYFSDIPNRLESMGRKVSIVSILGLKKIKYSSLINKQKNIPNYYFTNTLSPIQELKIIYKLIFEAIRLKKISTLFKTSKSKIFDLASSEALSPGTHFNLRLSLQVKNLIKQVNPKFLVCTYEGHAYERIIFSSARQVNPNIICISYQHTGVFEMSNAIKIKLSNQFNPNYIFTSGVFGKEDLKKSKDLNEIKILKFGSKRGLLNSKKNKRNYEINYCLVIPEVFVSECNKLFDFCISYLSKYSNVKFIFRLHPGISFEKIIEQNKNFKNLSKNIILSTDTLENDIDKSKWVLYRGSSAVFKAISDGLRPIYLDYNNEISLDPLFRLQSFKKNVTIISHLNKIFNEDIKNNFIESINQKHFLRKFCNNQFSEIDMSCFEKVEKYEN